jgi:HEAT repeat protein
MMANRLNRMAGPSGETLCPNRAGIVPSRLSVRPFFPVAFAEALAVRTRAAALALTTVLLAAVPARGQEPGDDPVEAVRQALNIGAFQASPELIKTRGEALAKAIGGIKTVTHLRQVLSLSEWRDDDAFSPERAKADANARKVVVDRLADELARVANGGDETAKVAAAQMLSSFGSIRGSGPKASLGRELTGLAVALAGDKTPAVRAAAARGLGRMDPAARDATAALKGLLKDSDATVRRAAAQGLRALAEEALRAWKAGRITAGREVVRQDLVEIAAAAVATLAAGSGDPDAEVRRLCLEAYQAAAIALGQLAPEPAPKDRVPAVGTPVSALTKLDRDRLEQAQLQLDEAEKRTAPLSEALAAQARLLQAGLEDKDEAVVRAAAAAVEELAAARRLWRAYSVSVPALSKDNILVPGGALDPFGDDLRAAVPLLAKHLGHTSVEVKLAVLYALETLERDAAPAAAALAKTLDDADAFVRWGAARALGRMAGFEGKDVDTAVKALGKRLADDNIRVRTTAAVALKHYGPAAKAAAADLASAVAKSDDETRKLAMRALARLGADAKPAVAALAEALAAKETSVRLEAARTLGQIGPAARDALPALRKALDDADAAVALAAAEAVLAIGAAK